MEFAEVECAEACHPQFNGLSLRQLVDNNRALKDKAFDDAD